MTTLFRLILISTATLSFPLSASARDRAAPWRPLGQVAVRNDAATVVDLTLDGANLGALVPGAVRDVSVAAGPHALRATYRQLGEDRLLSQQTLSVPADGRADLDLIPVNSGLVRVENGTGRDGAVVVDGLSMGHLPVGGALDVQTRLGRVSLALVDARGEALARTDLAVGRYENDVWRAAAPATGDLVVNNPLPMTVVAHDGSGRAWTVGARSDVTLADLPVGNDTVTLARTSGEPLDVAVIAVRPYELARYTVPMPTTGLVALRNDAAVPLTVFVDGRPLSSAAPYGEAHLALNLGWHLVQLRDGRGHVVWDARIDVNPFTTEQLSFGTGGVSSCEGGRGEDRDEADWHERPEHR